MVRMLHYRFSLRLKALALTCALLVTLLLVARQRVEEDTLAPVPWPLGLPRTHEWVNAFLRDRAQATNNSISFQIVPPLKLSSSSEAAAPLCPSGFYTRHELRPHLPRPAEQPSSPGAYGLAFVPGHLSAEELRERERGLKTHCFNQFASDRISVHRGLGNDTRPPE